MAAQRSQFLFRPPVFGLVPHPILLAALPQSHRGLLACGSQFLPNGAVSTPNPIAPHLIHVGR
jgi:hypothetical protein